MGWEVFEPIAFCTILTISLRTVFEHTNFILNYSFVDNFIHKIQNQKITNIYLYILYYILVLVIEIEEIMENIDYCDS